jgi:hypothetical protein
MKTRSRFVLPLAAALLLGAALVVRFFLSSPEVEPSPVVGSSSVKASSAQAPAASEPVAPASAAAKPEPVKAEGPTSVQLAEGPATVVPVGPGDVVPEPEAENNPPQPNDPIEPEKPQTAAWKHEKTVHMTALLDRDVERLDGERQAALSRGDEAEVKRLEVQLARHRARLGKLREEAAALSEAARAESVE